VLNCLILCNLSHGFEFGLVRVIIEMCLTCIEEVLILQAVFYGVWDLAV
jgi:hypothetical protein